MLKLNIQAVASFFQVIWALPFIGIIFIIHPILPIFMGSLHIFIAFYLLINKWKMSGHMFGVIASVISMFAAFNFNIFAANLIDTLPELVLSWPFHIVSAVMTLGNHRMNSEAYEQFMKENAPEKIIES